MKKLIIILTMIMAINQITAEEYVLKSMKFYYLNTWEQFDVMEVDLRYITDKELKGIYLDILSVECRGCIKITPEIKDTLLYTLKKYKEWYKKASQKQVEIKKTITSFPAVFLCSPIIGDPFINRGNVSFKFISASVDKHMLIAYIEEMSSMTGYSTCEIDNMILGWDEVEIFIDALNNMEKWKREKDQVESIYDEFN